MIIDTSKFCDWELKKLMKLINLAIDIDFDFQECGLNENSGNVWLFSYDYASCLFADINGSVGVSVTCGECGCESEFWLKEEKSHAAREALKLVESHACKCKQEEV